MSKRSGMRCPNPSSWLLLVLTLSAACGRRAVARAEPHAHPSTHRAKRELPRLPCDELSHAYAASGASADQIYQGKRFTVLGNVVSVNEDGGTPHVVLGSKLEPVVAHGVAKEAAVMLIPNASIELDCVVTGSIADIPQLDCGPHGIPRAISSAHDSARESSAHDSAREAAKG